MKDFEFYVPTKIHFGKNGCKHLTSIIKPEQKILLVYGGGSILSSGLYDKVKSALIGYTIIDFAGVSANPLIEEVEAGAKLCKQHNIDIILAVGGGSVVDCSKGIAAVACQDLDAWTCLMTPQTIVKALPIVDIITLSGTGSEMNCTGVVTNKSCNQKRSFASSLLFPVASILDPTNTYTLPPKQTAAGCADILSHLIEIYFNRVEGAFVQERICESLMKTVLHYGPIAYQTPNHYEARSNLMWAATLTLNTTAGAGFAQGWSCHAMQHVLGAVYNNTHGIGLAILTPAWMRYILDDTTISRFVLYGTQVFGIDSTLDDYTIANQAIDQTQAFFVEGLHIPKTLHEVGIDDSRLEEMAKLAADSKKGSINGMKPLKKEDVLKIYKMCQ